MRVAVIGHGSDDVTGGHPVPPVTSSFNSLAQLCPIGPPTGFGVSRPKEEQRKSFGVRRSHSQSALVQVKQALLLRDLRRLLLSQT